MAFNQNKPTPNSPLNSAEIRDNFQHLKTAISQEHTWDDNNAEIAQHKLDTINATFTGSKQANLGGGSYQNRDVYYYDLLKTASGVKEGKYSLQDLLQQLVDRSHAHVATGFLVNCNCNCNCNCGGNN